MINLFLVKWGINCAEFFHRRSTDMRIYFNWELNHWKRNNEFDNNFVCFYYSFYSLKRWITVTLPRYKHQDRDKYWDKYTGIKDQGDPSVDFLGSVSDVRVVRVFKRNFSTYLNWLDRSLSLPAKLLHSPWWSLDSYMDELTTRRILLFISV